MRLDEIEFGFTNQICLKDQPQRVFEMNVPCNAIATSVDIIFYFTFIGNFGRNFESPFENHRRRVDDGRFGGPQAL